MIMSRPFVKAMQGLAGARSTGQRLGALASLLKADLKQVVELVTTAPFAATPHKPRISIVEGLTDPFVGINMGQTAEILAKEFNISREEQDAWPCARTNSLRPPPHA